MERGVADWNAMKIEYVTTNTSYRKIAKKYNVSAAQVANHAKDENWVNEKERYQNNTYTKTLSALTNEQVKRVARLRNISDKILNKIEAAIDTLTESDLQAYRQITSALKDIKEIQMLKYETDAVEQSTRIESLQNQMIQKDETDNMTITIKGWDDSWKE